MTSTRSRAFSSGGNLKEMERSLDGNPAEFFEAPLARIHDAALSLAQLPRPVVGAIQGFAAGAGFNLALCCDLLLCSPETRFHQAFVRIGAVPDTGGTFFLTRRVGYTRALELFLLGDFVDAERALEHLVPLDFGEELELDSLSASIRPESRGTSEPSLLSRWKSWNRSR